MKTAAKKPKTTTVSCDAASHKYIIELASQLGITQREALARLVDSYRHGHKRFATSAAEPQSEGLSSVEQTALEDRLSKVITKDVNRVIGFIQQQEKSYLKNILEIAKNNQGLIQNLANSLDNFDNPPMEF